VSTPSISPGRGLYEVTEPDGTRWVTNLTRKLGGGQAPAGRGLVNTATVLLAILDAGLFAVSLMAQYQYIFTAKHQSWPAYIEAVALDAAMIVFSLLALGLARAGQSAPVERILIIACALGSAAMNYAAADVSSPRSVAAYVMPPIALAIVTDRVIAVVRRHVLGMEAERSAWASLGRGALVVLGGLGRLGLYSLRLTLAPKSTLGGVRRSILMATPLPGAPAVALVLDPVRAALNDDLREVRDRYELTAANLDGNLRAAQETLRTETEAVRETLRTEIEAVREAARTEAPAAVRAELGAVRAALGENLRELRERHEAAAADLGTGLRAAQEEFRTETEAVREAVRTETEAVRETLRTEIEAVREAARTEAPGAVRAALGENLRELRERHEAAAADLGTGLRAAQEEFRTETEAVREAVRTETEAVRETLRTEIEAVREAIRTELSSPGQEQTPGADRAALVAELADRIRAAASNGKRWTPDYEELMTRTGYRHRWCQDVVRDARAQVKESANEVPAEPQTESSVPEDQAQNITTREES
jgi:hypothetical protein